MEKELPKTAAQLRNELYKWCEYEFECFLTDKQKSELKKLVTAIYEYRTIDSRKENDAALKHEIICPKCGDYKLKVGKKFKFYKKRLPESVEVKTIE